MLIRWRTATVSEGLPGLAGGPGSESPNCDGFDWNKRHLSTRLGHRGLGLAIVLMSGDPWGGLQRGCPGWRAEGSSPAPPCSASGFEVSTPVVSLSGDRQSDEACWVGYYTPNPGLWGRLESMTGNADLQLSTEGASQLLRRIILREKHPLNSLHLHGLKRM